MNDQDKTREQLIAELAELRLRVAEQHAQLVRSQQAEADQRQINDRLPVLVVTAGLDGYYKEVNTAFERILGWSEQESLSRPYLEFIHPEDRAMAAETLTRVRSGEPAINIVDRNICKDGSHRWISWIVTPVPGRDIVFGIGQDITEKKLAEDDRERTQEAIRQSEQRMRLHVQQTPLAVIEHDVNGRVTNWNPGAKRVFGYTEQEALGEHFSLVIPPESREHVAHVWSALLAKKGGERSTNKNVTKDGRTILCEWYSTPLINAEGQVIGVASLAEDITERQRAENQLHEANERLERRVEERTAELQQANGLLQAEVEQRQQIEEALRESEQRMQMALEVSRSYAFEWDVATDRVLRSDSCSCVLGLSGGEALHDTGQAFFQRIHIDDRDRFVRMLGELRPSADTFRTEYRAIRGDGATVVLEESARGFFNRDGMLCRVVGVTTDITERKRAETELRASKERFELVVRGAGVGIWDWDIRTGKVYCSPRWKMLFGYEENEIGVGFEDWARLLHPDERDRIVKFQEDFLAGTASTITAEYRLRHKDGSYRWIAGHGVVVRDEQGKAIRLVGSHGDITDRKLAEEEVKAEQRALRRMLMASDHEHRLLTYAHPPEPASAWPPVTRRHAVGDRRHVAPVPTSGRRGQAATSRERGTGEREATGAGTAAPPAPQPSESSLQPVGSDRLDHEVIDLD